MAPYVVTQDDPLCEACGSTGHIQDVGVCVVCQGTGRIGRVIAETPQLGALHPALKIF